MAVSDYSTTPANNTFLGPYDLRENNMLVSDINDFNRYLMADLKAFSLTVPNGADYVTKTGGVFTGQPTFTGRGAYLHHNSSALTSGRIFMQASGGATPSGMAAGDWLIEY